MAVHLVNPSHLSFGVGVITPRWLFFLGAATPASYGTPLITDETLEPFMDRLAQLPSDMVSFTQITMEAAEDAAFLTAMRRANIKGVTIVSARPSTEVMLGRFLTGAGKQLRLSREEVLYWQSDVF